MIKFGERDNHDDDSGKIISRKTIEDCIDEPDKVTFSITSDDKNVGGVILKIDEITQHNYPEILFVIPEEHTKGIGYATWKQAEKMYPDTKIRETCTPIFWKNIHFYINKRGFQIYQFGAGIFNPTTEFMKKITNTEQMKCFDL